MENRNEQAGFASVDKTETVHGEIKDPNSIAGQSVGFEIGSERRNRIEKRLKLKLDARFSILVRQDHARLVALTLEVLFRCKFTCRDSPLEALHC